jgi:hypothetical protein
LGIGAEHFPWPLRNDPDRAPYRGWAPLGEADAAVFFGRDAQIVRGLDALHGMRSTGVESLFVILGPSGAGKSSFLRAGLLPGCAAMTARQQHHLGMAPTPAGQPRWSCSASRHIETRSCTRGRLPSAWTAGKSRPRSGCWPAVARDKGVEEEWR